MIKKICFIVLLTIPVFGIHLYWHPPEGGPEVAGYYFYYKNIISSNTFQRIDVGNQTNIEFDLNTNGSTYAFYVTAYNPYGLESDPSNMFIYYKPIKGLPYVLLEVNNGKLIQWPSEVNKTYSISWDTNKSANVLTIGPWTAKVITNHTNYEITLDKLDK